MLKGRGGMEEVMFFIGEGFTKDEALLEDGAIRVRRHGKTVMLMAMALALAMAMAIAGKQRTMLEEGRPAKLSR